jgi:hypothetical protein
MRALPHIVHPVDLLLKAYFRSAFYRVGPSPGAPAVTGTFIPALTPGQPGLSEVTQHFFQEAYRPKVKSFHSRYPT